MTATVLPQLEEIISAQEASVEAQLAEVRAKLEAVRSVLSLFDGSSDSLSAAEVSEKVTVVASSKSTAKAPAKAKAKTTRKAKTETKSSGSKAKKDGRAASWQKYTCEGVGDQPMPESVRLILAT